ncbi:MAG: SRPBCC family protein [Armatimonadota bacterium]|nr:SRPBCC family protein [Armatimonadota bacterium]MDR7444190.1 SRPBCC family protein [Armatimonadota bacterium]MDR7570600.1 SRPBCC family protein [Armatimonadota bacterium]MDR7614275.1 SRPBCC family protein [Armatimonadota bacterium]
MSPPRGVAYTGSRYFRVPPRQVYGMVARLDRLPRWSGVWMRAEVVERKPHAVVVHLKGYLAGIPVESVIRATLTPHVQVAWQQAYGTFLDYAGSFQLELVEEGTLLRYGVVLDPGISFLSPEAVHQILVQEVEHTLNRLKWSAERDILAEEIRLQRGRGQSQGVEDESSMNASEG